MGPGGSVIHEIGFLGSGGIFFKDCFYYLVRLQN